MPASRRGVGVQVGVWAVVACAASSVSLCAPAFAQMDPGEPGEAMAEQGRLLGASREVASWDFESREDRLFDTPRGWFRSLHDPEADPPSFRPGFPPYNRATLAEVMGGSWAAYLPTQGGSTSLMLARGLLPAMPGSDYLLTAEVRTKGLTHAAARVGVRFVDENLEPIPGAGQKSAPVRTGGEWTTVQVRLTGNESAAYIQIELQLVQPEQFEDEGPLTHEVRHEDISGESWFDNLRLYQVPRIDFACANDDNIVTAPAQPELRLSVQDFTGEDLVASAYVYDVDGAIVARRQLLGDGSNTELWSPELPAYGWYRAVVRLRNETGYVGQSVCDLAWLPRDAERSPDELEAFGVVLGEAHELEEIDKLPGLLRELRTGSAWLGVWENGEGRGFSSWESERALEVAGVVEGLIDQRHRLTFVLSEVPRSLAESARVSPDEVMGVALALPEETVSALTPVLLRFGESASAWQLGGIGSREASRRIGASEESESIAAGIGRVLSRPVLALPWSPARDARAMGLTTDALTVRVPDWMRAESIEALVAHHDAFAPDQGVQLVLTPGDESEFGAAQGVKRVVLQAIAAWAAGAEAVAIDRPWVRSRRAGGEAGPAMPTALFPAWRMVSGTLAGREVLGELRVAEGARAIIAGASTEESGLIVAWNETAAGRDAVLRARLGSGPVRVQDQFGNTRVYELEGNEHVIPLGTEPVFITGIDTELVLFRSGLRLEPAFLESRAQRHGVELVVRNPWPDPIQVAVRFVEPGQWDFQPRVMRVALPAYGEERLPLELGLGVGETSGVRVVETEVALTTPRGDQPVQRVPMYVELGMEDLLVSPTYRYVMDASGNPESVVVSLLIANRGTRPIPLQSFAFAPGQAAQESLVPSLGPGQAVVRRFTFSNAGGLVGQRVRVGIREVNGNGRLNYWLDLR